MFRSIAAFSFALVALGSAAAGSVGAVLSQVRGDVTLQADALGGPRYPAWPLQTVAAGSTLHLASEAQAVVICADDRAVRLSGPRTWQPGTGSCREGSAVAKGTYARLLPSHGRVRDFHGSLLAEAPSRSGNEDGKIPVLLEPRSPQRLTVLIADASPTLVWAEVRKALRYELVLQRGGAEVTKDVPGTGCLPDPRSEPFDACIAAWPWPPLQPGEEVELRVRVHVGDPDRPVRTTDASKLRRIDGGTERAVRERLADLADGGLPEATHQLLRADVYSEAELFNEAAGALAVAQKESPSSMVSVRLADLYLGLGQMKAALNEYGRAERLLKGGADKVRAALYLGRGRAFARRGEAYLAAKDFQKAEKIYRRLGQAGEADTAKREAYLAQRGEL